MAQVVFRINSTDEVLGVGVHLEEDYVHRWSKLGGEVAEEQGEPGDGTTIDISEPFQLEVRCDEDGWEVRVNKEPPFEHFYHDPRLDMRLITSLTVTGDIEVNFIGFIQDGRFLVFILLLYMLPCIFLIFVSILLILS